MLDYQASQPLSPKLAELYKQAAGTVVPYSEDYREAHVEFATKVWPTKRRRRDEHYIRWKLRAPEHGPIDGLLLAVVDGKVVGQLGLIPASVKIGTGVYSCQWAVDLMVDASMRRKRIASLLLATAMARDVVTLVCNPTHLANLSMLRVGFQPLTGPRYMMLPIQLSLVLSWKLPESLRSIIPLLSRLGQPLATMRCRAITKANRKVEAISCEWRESASLIEAKQASITDPQVVHDLEFLKWRCSGLSGFSPELGALRTGSGSYAVVGAASPFFDVYDWSANDPDDFAAIFHGIYKLAKKSKTEIVRSLAQDDREESWLKNAGFIPTSSRSNLLCYPPDKLVPNYQNFHHTMLDSDESI